jgi:hypothetical protein
VVGAATAIIAHGDTAKFWRLEAGVLVWAFISVTYWLSYRHNSHYLIQAYLEEQNLPPGLEPAIHQAVNRIYRPFMFWN